VLILTDIDKGVGEITTAMKESEEYDYFFDSLGQLYSELAVNKESGFLECVGAEKDFNNQLTKIKKEIKEDGFEKKYEEELQKITDKLKELEELSSKYKKEKEEYLNKSSLAYEQYLKKFPVNHHVMEKLGIIYEKLGQEKKAKELFSKVKSMKM
jgi:DNA repair ATPase RecN